MKLKILGYGIYLGSILLFAVNAQAAVSTGAESSASGGIKLKKGAKIYVDHCRICHGDNGDGNTRVSGGLRPPPRNFRTIETALELTRERMVKSVTEGRPGTGMMPHKDRLSSQDIESVVDFIRSSFMRTPDENDAAVKNIEGLKIYNKNCSVCHGDKGSTAAWARSGLNPPPRDFTTAAARRDLSRERMILSVTKGRPGTGMMPFTKKLNKKQIAQVVDYIRETFLIGGEIAANLSAETKTLLPQDRNHARMRESRVVGGSTVIEPTIAGQTIADPHANMQAMMKPGGQAQNGQDRKVQPATMTPGGVLPGIIDADMSLPMPADLKGDVEAGRKFFMGNCYVCHGVTGEGNGPRASFNIPRPRNFTTEESRRMFNRVRLFQSITNGKVGTVMPAWRRVLSPQEIANVAEFVFQHFIRAGGDNPSMGSNPKIKAGSKKKPS